MRKKFTMLFAALLAFAGVAKAGVTDLPQMSEGENIKWYTISNTRSASGKYLYWTESGVKDSNTRTGASFFYVTGSADACYIHNYATDLLFSGAGAWTEAGVACKLTVSSLNTGLMIGFNGTYLNEQNSANGFTTWSDINDAGSVFVFEEVTDFSAVIDVPAAKATAIAALEDLALIPVFTAAATEAIAKVEAVEAEGTGLAELNAAIEEINAIVAASKKASLDGKFFTLYTAGRSQYAKMTATGTAAAATATTPDFIWQFVENNGVYNIYNPYTGKYLGALGGVGGPSIAVTANQAEAGAYNIDVVSEEVKDDQGNVTGENVWLAFNVGGAYIHLNGSLLPWYAGGSSYWTIAEVTDFADMVSAHKNSSVATLDSWKSLSVVFDAALVDAAKTAINGINSTDWATFAAIDAELKKVTDAVASKHVVFKNSNTTDPNRSEVYLATDMSDNKGRGNKEFDYNAVWNLQSAGGTSFYLYNALNKVYMGTPGSEGALTSAPAAAFTFEVVDASTSLVEIKTGGQTMHVHNWADCTLTNYDGNETASRWYVSIFDITTDIQALIEANASKHAEVPELGQYPTAAYNALVAAKSTVKNAGEVEAAIAAFKAAKNLPVFTISNGDVKDYTVGKSIYDDNDGAPNFKATNVYDKTMWWALDMTETAVKVTEEVGIYNVGTGNGFWGASSIKIAETSDAVVGEDDDLFLFYTTGNSTTLHFQDYNQVIVRYNSTEATSGSAAKFTYIGNTYDLNKLTDAHVAALSELQAAYAAKARYADVVIGDGIGEYQGDGAIIEALEAAKAIADKSLTEKAAMTVEDILAAKDAINNAEALVINQPKAGFYRIKSMNANDENKKGKNLLVSDGALALDKTESAASIMYIDAANGILNYGSGLYINTWNAPAEVGAQAVGWNFIENAQVAGTYALKYNDNTGGQMGYYLSDWTGNVTYGQNDANAAWIFEEVTELPVAVSAAGYATLYAPVALTIAEGVTAYTATIAEDDKTLNLNKVEGTIPAETGVILEAEAGSYNFAVAADVAAIEGNALVGSFAKSAKNPEAKVYTLQMPNKEDKESVGFYLFKGYTNEEDQEGTKTYINGFRAWIEVAEGEEAPAMFAFGRGAEDDEESTGIESVELNGELVIYDLAGRRVEKMEKGIYIVNGRKVVVK